MKDIFQNPFLIINEAYLLHFLRLEMNVLLFPVNKSSNPKYMIKSLVFDMLSTNLEIESSLRTYNSQTDIHSHYHRTIVALFRAKLDPNIPDSYGQKYKEAKNNSEK